MLGAGVEIIRGTTVLDDRLELLHGTAVDDDIELLLRRTAVLDDGVELLCGTTVLDAGVGLLCGRVAELVEDVALVHVAVTVLSVDKVLPRATVA